MQLSAGAEWWNIEKSTMLILPCQRMSPNYVGGGIFTIKCAILPKSLLILLMSWTDESSVLFYVFFYIILHKWYFYKLYTIR